MFNSITGTITHKLPQTVYVENRGLEWDITVPLTSIDLLPNVGETAKIYTWLYHREDSMKLFGFATEAERGVFIDLMKVEGVGAKAAVRILSSVSARELAEALDSENIARLEKIPGVGKKTAQKMMLTLKGKLSLDEAGDFVKVVSSRSGVYAQWADLISALMNMGYEKHACEETVEKLLQSLEEDADFKSKNKTAREELLFRRAIIELA